MELFHEADNLPDDFDTSHSPFEHAIAAVTLLADTTSRKMRTVLAHNYCSNVLISLPMEITAQFLPELVKLSNLEQSSAIDKILTSISQRSLCLALQIYLLFSCEEQEISPTKTIQISSDDPDASFFPVNQNRLQSPSLNGIFSPSSFTSLSIPSALPVSSTTNPFSRSHPSTPDNCLKLPFSDVNERLKRHSVQSSDSTQIHLSLNPNPHLEALPPHLPSFESLKTFNDPQNAGHTPSSTFERPNSIAFENNLKKQTVQLVLCSLLRIWKYHREMEAKGEHASNLSFSTHAHSETGSIASTPPSTPSTSHFHYQANYFHGTPSPPVPPRYQSKTPPNVSFRPVPRAPDPTPNYASFQTPHISSSMLLPSLHTPSPTPTPTLLERATTSSIASLTPPPSSAIFRTPSVGLKQISKASVMIELVEYAGILGSKALPDLVPTHLNRRYKSFTSRQIIDHPSRKHNKKSRKSVSKPAPGPEDPSEPESTVEEDDDPCLKPDQNNFLSQPQNETKFSPLTLPPAASLYDPPGDERDPFGSDRCHQFALSLFVYDCLKDVSKKVRLEDIPKRKSLCIRLIDSLNEDIAPGWTGERISHPKSAHELDPQSLSRAHPSSGTITRLSDSERAVFVPERPLGPPHVHLPPCPITVQSTPSLDVSIPQNEGLTQPPPVQRPSFSQTTIPISVSSPPPSYVPKQAIQSQPTTPEPSTTPCSLSSDHERPRNSLQLGRILKLSFILPATQLTSSPRLFLRFVSSETRLLKSRERAPIMVWMETCGAEDWSDAMQIAERKRAELEGTMLHPQTGSANLLSPSHTSESFASLVPSPVHRNRHPNELSPVTFPTELLSAKEERISRETVFSILPSWRLTSLIVKEHDDIRQDALVSHMLTLIQSICHEKGVRIWLRPFCVMPTSPTSGLMETLVDTVSIHEMKEGKKGETVVGKGGVEVAEKEKKKDFKTISQFLFELYPNTDDGEESEGHRQAVRNFLESLAGYSIATYILQLKDRHNANILISSAGHLIHIDFGFILTRSPGGVSFEQSPFKLTKEYAAVIGGKKSPLFAELRNLIVDGLMALRANSNVLCQSVLIQSRYSGLPCFYKPGELIAARLGERLFIKQSDEAARKHFQKLVDISYNHTSTHTYDMFQWWSNRIRY
ncbi:putative Phosphatidylinositol 4-kinase beta [Blattamonas nauphoetae]|uniref:Phosphatidylinositol 4-kinase beta n=1 Tax=Blattamonas nauphoetae TaxID=2049346 RepID=A0ABQ9YI95_9EUKA|nr:putative Phosphatidylinositol 4-kinase beta [Blattamonas nauphoetae]